MKQLFSVLLLFFLSVGTANAHVECIAETHSGTLVSVFVETLGSMGYVNGGLLKIQPANGPSKEIKMSGDDIPQFYEGMLGNDEGKMMAGLSAFVETLYPVRFSYRGINYWELDETVDLVSVLRDPNRKKQPGNLMEAWDGDKNNFNTVYKFRDVVCGMFLDP